jgi:hypothetical protein
MPDVRQHEMSSSMLRTLVLVIATAVVACADRTAGWRVSLRSWGGPPGSDQFLVKILADGQVIAERHSGRTGAVVAAFQATLSPAVARRLRAAAATAIRDAPLHRLGTVIADGTNVELSIEGNGTTITCTRVGLYSLERAGPELARVVEIVNAVLPDAAKVF